MFAINEAFGEVAARVDYILPNLIAWGAAEKNNNLALHLRAAA